ncbi:MAG: aldehyde dehydrogenase [Flavobacteriaceae bacterium]|jgi:aldehyde dehydrogenase (NAD+)|nr:aldehyde dehydrogenase [Flavobacteriaceae bacterium]MDG1309910.1 aldehyde dehydrogenase [Flavobacteriaceae bacterium]
MEAKLILETQKEYFKTRATRDVGMLKKLLTKLRSEILAKEDAIYEAVYKDLRKSKFEAYFSEIGVVISEIDSTLKHIDSWSKPKKIRAAGLNFPSRDYIYSEPYGTVLIIAPWNYPFQLAVAPLIAAIAAGNTVVLKPSEHTTHTSQLIEDILSTVFIPEHVKVVQGGIPETTMLLKERWDYIFFTGSVAVGKIVAKAAAPYLTPVTLELGGKNPCIVDNSMSTQLIAKRLVWGKFVNAGQTCIAPDYLLVHSSIKAQLISDLKTEIVKAYGQNPQTSTDYSRIVNATHLSRLTSMLTDSNVIFGGTYDDSDSYLAPTLIDEPSLDSEVMKDEIFGPILPILSYDTESDIDSVLSQYEKPLGFYVFSNDTSFYKKMIETYSFGGGTINDTMVQFGNSRLPFGGVGESGIGAYHGRLGFDTFSHKKGIVIKANWIDIPLRYAPYKNKLEKLKLLFKFLG